MVEREENSKFFSNVKTFKNAAPSSSEALLMPLAASHLSKRRLDVLLTRQATMDRVLLSLASFLESRIASFSHRMPRKLKRLPLQAMVLKSCILIVSKTI
jgi:hypothetical protein